MATKKKKTGTPRNDVTLAIETKKSKKQAMIQQINDLGTEDLMTRIRGRPLAELGLQEVGMKNMTNLVEAHEGYELPIAGFYQPREGANPLVSGRGDHDPSSKDHHRGKYHHTGDKEFRKTGKEFVSIPIAKQTSPSKYRQIAAHEYLHAGQSRLPSEVFKPLGGSRSSGKRIHPSLLSYRIRLGREAVATLQGTKSPHKEEIKATWDRFSADYGIFTNSTKAIKFAKKWLPIQNKAAQKLLDASRKHPKAKK
jgi:hypothetical protein